MDATVGGTGVMIGAVVGAEVGAVITTWVGVDVVPESQATMISASTDSTNREITLFNISS